MNYVNLGKSDLAASRIALGCMRLGAVEYQDAYQIVNTAFEKGINFFDHADIYGGGECETIFNQVLKDSHFSREEILIQSKCGIRKGYFDFSKEHILNSVDGILKRLNTDYLDSLLLHRPDSLMEPEEVAEAFYQLEKSGKVRYFGVSNQNPLQIQLLNTAVKQDLIVNQLQFGLMHTNMVDQGLHVNMQTSGGIDYDGSILDYCQINHMTVQAWSPYQVGFFEGVFLDNKKYPDLNEELSSIAEKYQTTKTGIATAWILRHPAKIQTIVGTMNAKRLDEICTASELVLSRQEWYALYQAAGNILP